MGRGDKMKLIIIFILISITIVFIGWRAQLKEYEQNCEVIGKEEGGQNRTIWDCPDGIKIF